MTANSSPNIIHASFGKAATEEVSFKENLKQFEDFARFISGVTESGGVFGISAKPDFPVSPITITYSKPFKGEEPRWEQMPFFSLSKEEGVWNTTAAVLALDRDGKLQKQFVIKHHQTAFADTACSHLEQWARTVNRPLQFRSLEGGLSGTPEIKNPGL